DGAVCGGSPYQAQRRSFAVEDLPATLHTEDLAERGLVAPERLDELRRVAENFAVALTEEVAGLIDPADPNDPIAAQFVPSAAELQIAPEERADPIGDQRWSPVPGIVHRYPDRV